jgi:hypothetical protein
MKKISLLLIVVSVTLFSSHAQHFKKFKLGIGTGYALPVGESPNEGGIVYFEPAYHINDRFTMGVRFETTLVKRTDSYIITLDDQKITGNTSFSGAWSCSVNGQYYFSNGVFRPFVGLGFGIYTTPSTGGSETSFTNKFAYEFTEGITSSQKIGVYPRVGFDAGHFSFNIEFNIGPSFRYENSFHTIPLDSTSTSTSYKGGVGITYLGIKCGFFIGGGRITS